MIASLVATFPASHRLLLRHRKAAILWMGLLGLCLAVLVVSALPPFVGRGGSATIRALFSSVCHQMPDRSFTVGGVPFALCHRCWGLATGLFLGVLLVGPVFRVRSGLRRRGVPILLTATGAMGAEWMLSAADLFDGMAAGRYLTGAAVGFVAAWFLTDAVLDWAGYRKPPPLARPAIAPPPGSASPTAY